MLYLLSFVQSHEMLDIWDSSFFVVRSFFGEAPEECNAMARNTNDSPKKHIDKPHQKSSTREASGCRIEAGVVSNHLQIDALQPLLPFVRKRGNDSSQWNTYHYWGWWQELQICWKIYLNKVEPKCCKSDSFILL